MVCEFNSKMSQFIILKAFISKSIFYLFGSLRGDHCETTAQVSRMCFIHHIFTSSVIDSLTSKRWHLKLNRIGFHFQMKRKEQNLKEQLQFALPSLQWLAPRPCEVMNMMGTFPANLLLFLLLVCAIVMLDSQLLPYCIKK